MSTILSTSLWSASPFPHPVVSTQPPAATGVPLLPRVQPYDHNAPPCNCIAGEIRALNVAFMYFLLLSQCRRLQAYPRSALVAVIWRTGD